MVLWEYTNPFLYFNVVNKLLWRNSVVVVILYIHSFLLGKYLTTISTRRYLSKYKLAKYSLRFSILFMKIIVTSVIRSYYLWVHPPHYLIQLNPTIELMPNILSNVAIVLLLLWIWYYIKLRTTIPCYKTHSMKMLKKIGVPNHCCNWSVINEVFCTAQ